MQFHRSALVARHAGAAGTDRAAYSRAQFVMTCDELLLQPQPPAAGLDRPQARASRPARCASSTSMPAGGQHQLEALRDARGGHVDRGQHPQHVPPFNWKVSEEFEIIDDAASARRPAGTEKAREAASARVARDAARQQSRDAVRQRPRSSSTRSCADERGIVIAPVKPPVAASAGESSAASDGHPPRRPSTSSLKPATREQIEDALVRPRISSASSGARPRKPSTPPRRPNARQEAAGIGCAG